MLVTEKGDLIAVKALSYPFKQKSEGFFQWFGEKIKSKHYSNARGFIVERPITEQYDR